MSNDLWDQLALVRTQELLAAGRRYGVDQYFTRVADFGFSKTLCTLESRQLPVPVRGMNLITINNRHGSNSGPADHFSSVSSYAA
jgi:LmbE family N-acetylglucosaminyl deacetylase